MKVSIAMFMPALKTNRPRGWLCQDAVAANAVQFGSIPPLGPRMNGGNRHESEECITLSSRHVKSVGSRYGSAYHHCPFRAGFSGATSAQRTLDPRFHRNGKTESVSSRCVPSHEGRARSGRLRGGHHAKKFLRGKGQQSL